MADLAHLDRARNFFNAAEIERLGRAGLAVAHCAASDMLFAQGICPTADLEAAGVPIGLGVDGSASNDSSNMMEAVRHSMMLRRLRYGPSMATPYDALRWGTEGSARCLGRDDIGAIAPGMEADVALFTLDEPRFSGAQDPVAALVLCGAHRADRVMVAGRWRVIDGMPEGVDLPALIARHKATAKAFGRVGPGVHERPWPRLVSLEIYSRQTRNPESLMPRQWLPSRLPIIQAPMAGLQGVELCVAVCEAGGLGSIPCAMLTPGPCATEIAEVRARTRAPFNVNFFCHTPPDARCGARGGVARSGSRLTTPSWHSTPAAGRAARTRAFRRGDGARSLEDVKPPVVSFHFGLPDASSARAREGDGREDLFAPRRRSTEARWLEARGVDAVIAQGAEAAAIAACS